MSDDCCEVPLIEKLRSVRKDYRTCEVIQWAEDGRETGHRFIPVGYMMHEAADEIESLRQQLETSQKHMEMLRIAVKFPCHFWTKEQEKGITEALATEPKP